LAGDAVVKTKTHFSQRYSDAEIISTFAVILVLVEIHRETEGMANGTIGQLALSQRHRVR